jgi:hypothetical protein
VLVGQDGLVLVVVRFDVVVVVGEVVVCGGYSEFHTAAMSDRRAASAALPTGVTTGSAVNVAMAGIVTPD